MARLGRLAAAIILVFGASVIAPLVAHATHCPPDHPPHPKGIPDNYPCPQPATPTPKPTATPAPTAVPTKAPTTPAPTHHVTTGGGTGTTTPVSTVEPSPFNIEVPNTKANATPQILVDPLNGTSNFNVDSGTQAASASSWIFGFIVGLIVGGLIGRASWGLRKRRRQQIFG